MPENVDYINSCANFTKNNIEQIIAQFYTKYIPDEKRNFSTIVGLKLTDTEKSILNWVQEDTNIVLVAQKANATRKDLLYAQMQDSVDDYYDCIYANDEKIPAYFTEDFAKQKLNSKEKMMQELGIELNNSIIRGESAKKVISNTNKIFEKHSESLPNIVQNFDEKISTYLTIEQVKEQGFEYYLYICNIPETACDTCARLHNTVHPISDWQSMPPRHPNCRCQLVLLNEAYIQSIDNTTKKSEENFATELLDGFQTALDLVGFIPGLGDIADGVNSLIYLARGDYFNAGLSAMAMVPFAGWISTGSKLGRKALKAADKIDDVAKIVNKADDVSGAIKGVEKDSKWVDEAGNIKWPFNQGFVGKPKPQTLKSGTRIDRYGNEYGSFVSPEGTPYNMRSLAPGTETKSYNIYEVVKPVEVKAGEISPWFDQPGGGTQYEFNQSINDLLNAGIIRKVK